jgi:hypothetical protein
MSIIIISQYSFFKGFFNSPYCKIYSLCTDALAVSNYTSYKEIFNSFSKEKWRDVHNFAANLLICDVYSPCSH